MNYATGAKSTVSFSGVNGKPIGIQEAGRFWHSDLSYMAIPSLGSIINALEMPPPEAGGNTHYAGMHFAYDALDPAMKKKLEGLQAVHDLSYRVRRDEGEGRPRLVISEELRERTTTTHPVVRTHPQTGRKVLFVNEGFTTAIAGWSENESRDLLYWTVYDTPQQKGLYPDGIRPEITGSNRNAADVTLGYTFIQCMVGHIRRFHSRPNNRGRI